MKDLIKTKELIIEQLPLVDVMLRYRVGFVFNPRGADQVQFKCPFHGRDNKPSARLYNTTNSCYCWVCKKSWDVVSFIGDKENLNFVQSLKHIVEYYKIDTSSIPDDPTLEIKTTVISEASVQLGCLRSSIKDIKYKIPLDKYKTVCLVYMMLEYAVYNGKFIVDDFKKLDNKIISLKGLQPA